MKSCFVVGLLLAMAASVAGFEGMPHCSAVDPDTAKTGDKVDATCQNADKTTFAELYLTDGRNDVKVAVTELAGDKIKFQVPSIKPGRYHLMFLSANKASMIEQPDEGVRPTRGTRSSSRFRRSNRGGIIRCS